MPRSRTTTSSGAAGIPPLRLFTPLSPFITTDRGKTVVLNPGMLVDEADPVYRRFPEKFRAPRVRGYD